MLRSKKWTTPQAWEVSGEWEEMVCKAVIQYPLAPREAKCILDLVGEIARYGEEERAYIMLLKLRDSIKNRWHPDAKERVKR